MAVREGVEEDVVEGGWADQTRQDRERERERGEGGGGRERERGAGGLAGPMFNDY